MLFFHQSILLFLNFALFSWIAGVMLSLNGLLIISLASGLGRVL